MKRLLSKRVIGALCLLLVLLFLLRPGAGWMRSRVSNSISQAVGRNVQVGYVRLRFLPRPGFQIEDLLVRDGLAFGSEPLLRAPEVDAALSLGALLRGRIEIASLSLSEPSLNLTRNPDGTWNLEDLIERTSHTSLAPTGTQRRTSAPAFPYIEATDARVNLKLGTEKTHFALTNATLALWQESENTWGARLKARPIRTDANLTDTGVLNVSGVWRRSAQVHQTPIQISFQWKQAQIGQVSTLIYGSEKPWRGAALVSGSILGTPEHLRISADASLDDFRRQDVFGGGNLHLAAHCTADYTPAAREIDNLDCAGPVGGGYLQAKGSASGILLNGNSFVKSDLWLIVNHAPAASVVNLLRHATPELDDDIEVEGDVSVTTQIQRTEAQQTVSIQGSGSIDDLEVARGGMDAVGFGTVPFTVTKGIEERPTKSPVRARAKKPLPLASAKQSSFEPQELHAEFGPINLAFGKSGPLTARVIVTRNGFTGSARGDAGVARLLQAARALNLPAPAVAAEGSANVNLVLAGEWFSGQRPLVTGTAHLRSIRAQVRGLNAPLNIASADVTISRDAVRVQNLSADEANAAWRGSLEIPRPCAKPSDCELQFKLRSDKLSASALNALLNPALRSKAWYRFLSLNQDQPSYFSLARASGKIAIDKLSFGAATCTQFTSDLQLNAGTVKLSDFRAECLDGKAAGTWEADFRAKPPQHSGKGRFEAVSMSTVANLMHDGWVEGVGGATYEFKAAGSNLQDLLDSAALDAKFKVNGGTFPHIVLTGDSGPLRAAEFSGTLGLRDRTLSFHQTKLAAGNEVYTISGTASLNGALNIKVLTETAGGYVIGGTLTKTRVSSVPNAQASLK